MKKILIGLLVLLLLLFSVSLLLTPRHTIRISRVAPFTYTGMVRYLGESNTWKNWWPGTVIQNATGNILLESGRDTLLLYKSYQNIFRFDQPDGKSTESLLQIFEDSTGVRIDWSTTLQTGRNPVSRFRAFFKAKSLKSHFEKRVDALRQFVADKKNIYGLDIRMENVQIEYLVSRKTVFPQLPSLEETESMIQSVRRFIEESNGKIIDSPMLNLTPLPSDSIQVQVGIPVAKKIPDQGPFNSKWMLKGGHILTAEVSGGPDVLREAMKQMDLYIQDMGHTAIAIPFQSMRTNRFHTKDSSQWKTKLFYPVI